MLDSWDRVSGETHKAHHAFTIYRDGGAASRSLLKVSQECSKHITLIKRWSVRWNWVSRATAYDVHLDRQYREHREKQLLEARDRHARLAQHMQVKVLERLLALDSADIPIMTLPQMLRIATDVELRALGDTMARVATEISGPGGGAVLFEDGVLRERLNHYADIIDRIVTERASEHSHSNGAGEPLDSARSD